MKFNFGVLVVLAVATCCTVVQSARILGLFTTFSKSHLIVHMSLFKSLVDRGHDLTVVTTIPLDEPDAKYRHIKLNIPPVSQEFRASAMAVKDPLYHFKIPFIIVKEMIFQTNGTMNDPQMKKLMAEESFDLVILGYFLNDFQIGVAAHFKCPVVISFMQQTLIATNRMVGNPGEPLYVPNIYSGDVQPLDFLQRLKGFLINLVEIPILAIVDTRMAEFYEYHFPSNKYPSFYEMRKNISLVFLNHHFSQGPIAPSVPAIIEVGGIQIKHKPDPLPKDIKQHLDSATETGAIYFCLGSNVRSVDMNPQTIEIVYKVLSSLKQKVIWKYEEDNVPGNSSNILFKKWLPQDDILAHSNLKLFITHGGRGGVTEAEYHGVPMVGMPIFADQFANMNEVEKAGYGLSLANKELTEQLFRSAVMEVLENPKYTINVKKFSELYRDRPMTAKETAAFWLEYVIRHKGAKHLQSPAVHMSLIQYYGLDVIGFLLAVLYIIYKVFVFIIKNTICRLFKIKCATSNVKNEKKRQ